MSASRYRLGTLARGAWIFIEGVWNRVRPKPPTEGRTYTYTLPDTVHGADVDPVAVEDLFLKRLLFWYCIAVAIACVGFVPWRVGKWFAGYAPLMLPPSKAARVDTERVLLELLAITAAFAAVWLGRHIRVRERLLWLNPSEDVPREVEAKKVQRNPPGAVDVVDKRSPPEPDLAQESVQCRTCGHTRKWHFGAGECVASQCKCIVFNPPG